MRLKLLFLTAIIAGCPPEDDGLIRGHEGKLFFQLTSYGFASSFAEGAELDISVAKGTDEAVAFSSSDDAVFTVTTEGRITTQRAGIADIVASVDGDALDRATFAVKKAKTIEVATRGRIPKIMVPGFQPRIELRRTAADGTHLVGEGGFTFETDGLEVRGAHRPNPNNEFNLLAPAVGTARFVAKSGDATETIEIEVVSSDVVDGVEELSRSNSGGSDDGRTVSIRVLTQAKRGDIPVAGGKCVWEVTGATVGLDSVGPSGEQTTDFWTDLVRFSATCVVGSVRKTFDIDTTPFRDL